MRFLGWQVVLALLVSGCTTMQDVKDRKVYAECNHDKAAAAKLIRMSDTGTVHVQALTSADLKSKFGVEPAAAYGQQVLLTKVVLFRPENSARLTLDGLELTGANPWFDATDELSTPAVQSLTDTAEDTAKLGAALLAECGSAACQWRILKTESGGDVSKLVLNVRWEGVVEYSDWTLGEEKNPGPDRCIVPDRLTVDLVEGPSVVARINAAFGEPKYVTGLE